MVMPIRFDTCLPYEAQGAQRRLRGMSWRQVAGENTLIRTKLGSRMEADGMLAMTR